MESNYKNLVVWQKSMALTVNIYKIVKKLPKEEMFALSRVLDVFQLICKLLITLSSTTFLSLRLTQNNPSGEYAGAILLIKRNMCIFLSAMEQLTPIKESCSNNYQNL